MARDLTNAILASPDQASTVFGIGGAHPIRQKNLFVMRFLRGTGEGGDTWANGISFLVKQIDRPTVTPVVEEVNQYNKKRQIHTGVKYQPINASFYDTADGAAMSMWYEYASYYFGDYRQTEASYTDDILNQTMNGADQGYGFGIQKATSTSIGGINTQFFFDRIEVYQVWGGQYTSFWLLNPKIINFDPDDLSYEDGSPSMISMQLIYENVYHLNGAKPQKISTSTILTEMFSGDFSGHTFDPSLGIPAATDFTDASSTPQLATASITSLLGNDSTVTGGDFDIDPSAVTTSTGGALSKFGNFNFGDFNTLGSSLPTELSTLATTNTSSLSTSFPSGLTTQQLNQLELSRIQAASNPDAQQAALGSNLSSIPDVGSAVSVAAGLTGTSPSDQVINDDDADFSDFGDDSSSSLGDFAYATPLLDDDDDDDVPVPAPNNAVVTSPTVAVKGGIALSPLAIAIVNARSDGTSTLGQRTKAATNPLLAYIVEPRPASALTPDLLYGRVHNASIKIAATVQGASHFPPVVGTLTRPIPIRQTSLGFVTTSGNLVGNVVIAGAALILNAISGSIVNAMVAPMIHYMAGVAPIEGAVGVIPDAVNNPGVYAPNVVITANIQSLNTNAGTVNRKNIVILGSLSGNVRNRAGTLYNKLPITIAATGVVVVSGTINEPIPVACQSLIIFPVHGDLVIPVPITCAARSTYIALRGGTITKTIYPTITAVGIVKNPNFGTISDRITITPNIVAVHKVPIRGALVGAVRIAGSGTAKVSFFGTLNKPVVVSGSLHGYVAPSGRIVSQIVLSSVSRGVNLLFGTITNDPVVVSCSASAHSTTNVSPSHRYWRIQSTTASQEFFGPNEVEFHTAEGGSSVTQGGTAISSSQYSTSYSPAKAFDRDGGTWWSSTDGGGNGWIGYDFGSGGDKNIAELLMATSAASRLPNTYDLQYSDDNSYWTTKFSGSIPTPADNTIYVTNAESTTAYTGIYRLTVTAAPPGGGAASFATLALYNGSGLQIPAMSPYASATGSGTPAGAFDGDSSTVWVSGSTGNGATLSFYAASLDTTIGSLTIRANSATGGGAMCPTDFIIEYSSDGGTTWATVYTATAMAAFSDGEQRTLSTNDSGVDVGDGTVLVVDEEGDALSY